MTKECTHEEYYTQFVTESLVKAVVSSIGKKKILASKDKHLNDIQLGLWDNLAPIVALHCASKVSEANASTSGGVRCYSLSDMVCVAKAAARVFKEKEN